jgi:hypothetical protein
MSRSKLPDVLEVWGHTWTKIKGKRGWVGPAITDPEDPTLAFAEECQRIIRRGGHYVMEDPAITLYRFCWTDDDAEGLTLMSPDGTEIPWDDEDAEEEA